MMNTVKVVCEFGDPGRTASARFSPLDECDKIDVGRMIRDEVNDNPYSYLPTLPVGSYVVHNGSPVVRDGMYVIYNKRIVSYE
jgi:hypothetical protein